MAIDLNTLSAKELESLIAQAKKRRSVLSKRKPVAVVRNRLEQLARAEGYSIAELFGGRPAPTAAQAAATKTGRKPSKSAGTKVAPKYRNPANESETWSGRGKQPRWLAAYTGQGRSLDEFRIV
jgi:DNA-binding protein H-NS